MGNSRAAECDTQDDYSNSVVQGIPHGHVFSKLLSLGHISIACSAL